METTSENAITLTEKAAAKLKLVRDGKEETKGKPLRIYVEGGGCCGMQYGMAFDEKQADDAVVNAHGIEIVMDGMSVDYLRGSTVDFDDSLQGAGFKIINPNAGCGGGCSSGEKSHGDGGCCGSGSEGQGNGCGCSH
ncbi:MAG: iron-sulfur cluster assembly accessory protein [Verrucomicrobia bacterium]|nr:iron-sulfur cluster assembly accessory protein [Verrucomicrobiota bacterium]